MSSPASPAHSTTGTRPALRWSLWALASVISFHTLLAYGLPPAVPLGGSLVLAVLYWWIGPGNGLLVALSLVLGTLFYGLALTVTGLGDAIYARPYQMLTDYDYLNDHKAFKKNARAQMLVRQGDLQSMTLEDLSEPHEALCQTDSDGFRNDRDYHGQRWVLVGDSFIAGVNNTQGETLSAQLLRDHGIDTYNLAHPGDLGDYVKYINGFRRQHGKQFKVLLFLFEGNDFPAGESVDLDHDELDRTLHGGYKRYLRMFSGTNVYRYTSSVYKRARNRRKIAKAEFLQLAELGGRRIAFYRPYVAVTESASYTGPEGFERALQSIGANLGEIFFIPTKYRVYHQRLAAPAASLPNAQWDYLAGLCERNHWRCSDLTPALTAASLRLLAEGRLTWWRDDTHWNPAGIAVAAQVVARELAGSAGAGDAPASAQ